jgi:hypothetical protein
MSLHEKQIDKTRKIAGYTLSILASAMVFFAGISKLMASEEMIKSMNALPNFSKLLLFVGGLELVLLLLYWMPKTSNLGFFLLCSFGGGCIVAEIVMGHPPMGGIMVCTLFYLGTILRKPSLLGLGI